MEEGLLHPARPEPGLLAEGQAGAGRGLLPVHPGRRGPRGRLRDRQGGRADRRRRRHLRRAAPRQAAQHLHDHQGLGDVRAPCLDHAQCSQRHPGQQGIPPGDDVRHRPRLREGRGLERLRQGRRPARSRRRRSSTRPTSRCTPTIRRRRRSSSRLRGYKGEALKFLGLPYGETWTRWAEAIKQNFADVGINMEIVTTDVPGWAQKTSNWDFDLTFNFLYQLGDPAIGVAGPMSAATSPGQSLRQHRAAIRTPRSTSSSRTPPSRRRGEKRQALYTKVQQLLAEELPVLWLLELEYPTIYAATSRTSSRQASA